MRMQNLYSVHLSTAKSWRGGENQIWLLARGLLARGQKVLVVAPPGAPLLDRCAAEKIPARALAMGGEINPLGALRLISLLRKERPDILHLHDGHAVLPGQLGGRAMSQKSMNVVAHRRTVFNLRGRWKYSGRVDCVIAISAAVKEKLLAAGIAENRIRTVYSGLEFPETLTRDCADAQAFRQKHKIPETAFVIGHAAALTSEKRQNDMIAAVHSVNEKLKANGAQPVHLVLAGTGDQEDALRAEVQKKALIECVHFAGFLRDLRPLWACSAMALFASEAEGLCTALIEAQGAGVPAVVTRAGGMIEVVDDGETGLLAEIGNVEQISHAILRLYKDTPVRARMCAAAEKRMRDKFSADVMVDGILRTYRELRTEFARS